MIYNYKIGKYTIHLDIQYNQRKTIEIRIISSSEVRVRVPKGLKEKEVIEFIDTKEAWIVRHLERFHIREENHSKHAFHEGEKHLYLGDTYSIKRVDSQKNEIYLRGDELIIETPKHMDTKEIIVNWYKKRCQELIEKRIMEYQVYFRQIPTKIQVKEQKKRWGSCNSKKELRFNWRLIKGTIEIIDYVVVHEMCHLVHMNHSKDFWALVNDIMPDYKWRRKWLKENGHRLF